MPIHPPLPHEAEHLVLNVVRSLSSAHLRKRRARRRAFWGVLAGIFAVGSHSAAAIARRAGTTRIAESVSCHSPSLRRAGPRRARGGGPWLTR